MTTTFTNIRTKLNIDVIQHILSYNDDLRILNIKMNKQNIKYLFENINELYTYLWCMKGSLYLSNIKEKIYVEIIELLSNKNYTMEEISNYILSYYDYCLIDPPRWFEYFINTIINNYNNYYLNDKYYYDGYWYRDEFHISEGKKFYDGYSRIMKKKMTERNIKDLFEINRETYAYLWCMEQQSSYPPTIEEKIYLDMITLLKNKKCSMEKIEKIILSVGEYRDHLLDPEYHYHFNIKNENWFKYFIHIIINNYNTYYLDDEYYFNGYWYENRWIKDDEKDYGDGYPYEFTL